ncbi:hypothetical protein [Kitasatospora sp. NPDC058046]|uniref:hypothetical protein n=1 Tax=Kitasatospora sp. NPDC058046 TaxID=3346312 RepID=UPI0036D840F0
MKTPPAPRRNTDTPEPTPEQRAEIVRRYQAGESVYKLRRELGVPETWLRTRLGDWGVTLRGYAEARKASREYRRRTR